jgi:hypothetical protein
MHIESHALVHGTVIRGRDRVVRQLGLSRAAKPPRSVKSLF